MIENYQPLYLKYRPQSLGDLVGQSSVAQTLSNAIANNRISHAYLFTGPRGCGKTSSARILAKSLNCDNGPTAEPCQVCTSCVEIKSGVSPSVIEIDAASNNSVDDARLLIERAPLVAQGGRFKLYIIDECHMLTKEAFNALLKTIEEPPPKVVFILATTEEHKVPPTIVSRCQRLMFRLINQADLGAHLKRIAGNENILIDDEAIGLVARRSGGGLRDALGLLDQASLLATPPQSVSVTDLLALLGAVHEDLLLEISSGVQGRDGQAVLTAIHSLMSEGREPAVLTLELARHFLNLAKASYVALAGSLTVEGLQALVLGSPNYLKGLVAQAPQFEQGELALLVEYLDRLEQTIRRSSQPALNLEMGLLSICHRHDIRLLRDMDERLRRLESEAVDNPVVRSSGAPAGGSRPATPQAGVRQAAQPAAGFAPVAPEPSPVTQAALPAAGMQPANRFAKEVLEGEEPFEEGPTARSGAASSPDSPASIAQTPPVSAAPRAEKASPAPTVSARPTAGDASSARPTAAQRPSAFGRSDEGSGEASGRSAAESEQPARQSVDLVALEEFWSNLLDELRQRNIPSFSLVSVHGFPISFDERELVVGVKENFQASLQSKVDHLQRAALAVLGREIVVKIKPMNQPAPRANQARGKSAKSAAPPGGPDREEPEGAKAGVVARLDARRSEPATDRGSQGEGDGETQNGRSQTNQSENGADIKRTSAGAVEKRAMSLDDYGEQGDATLFAEAYKLFEGPGSRVIG